MTLRIVRQEIPGPTNYLEESKGRSTLEESGYRDEVGSRHSVIERGREVGMVEWLQLASKIGLID